MFKKSNIPSLISLTRIILTPIIFYTILNSEYLIGLILFTVAGSTDFLDGYVARKIDFVSDKGATIDVLADFILVLVSAIAFVFKGVYNPLILFFIVLMFSIFIFSSKNEKLVYDPIGKHLGTYLMLMIFLSFLIADLRVIAILELIFVMFSVLSLISRAVFLRKSE